MFEDFFDHYIAGVSTYLTQVFHWQWFVDVFDDWILRWEFWSGDGLFSLSSPGESQLGQSLPVPVLGVEGPHEGIGIPPSCATNS